MRPLLALGLALLLMMVTRVPGTEATFGLTIAAAGATPVVFTAAQVTAIAGVAILAKAGKYFTQVEVNTNYNIPTGGLLGGLALGNILNRGRSSRRFRGRRDVSQEEVVEDSLAMLAMQEPEDCYKMVLCAASTGK